MPTVKQLYRNFLQEFDFCWACGRDTSYSSIPTGWYGIWTIDRAHIVNQPRVEDRRAVCALCRLCHVQQHGKHVVTPDRSIHWRPLKRQHLLWLKRKFDPEFYDRLFLQRYSIRTLPRAVAPPLCYFEEFQRRRAA